jgi:hypothetical protein
MSTQYLKVEQTLPATSRQRDLEDAVIPPFNYSGRLRVGLSGVWPAPYSMELSHGLITASQAGTSLAGFALMKQTALPLPAEVLHVWTFPATATRRVFSVRHPIHPIRIHVNDYIYVVSFGASAHTNIVIQFYGKKIIR